jgi:hypothetical protein
MEKTPFRIVNKRIITISTKGVNWLVAKIAIVGRNEVPIL